MVCMSVRRTPTSVAHATDRLSGVSSILLVERWPDRALASACHADPSLCALWRLALPIAPRFRPSRQKNLSHLCALSVQPKMKPPTMFIQAGAPSGHMTLHLAGHVNSSIMASGAADHKIQLIPLDIEPLYISNAAAANSTAIRTAKPSVSSVRSFFFSVSSTWPPESR